MTLTRVTSDGITDGTVVNADINSSAAIAGGKIANDSITATQIANDSITANELANNSVGNSHIINETIYNAEINPSAAIAGTKISPDFGSQAITTLGGITGGGLTSTSNVTINNDSPSVTFNDTNSENDFRLTNSHGTFVLFDNDAGATRMSCTSAGQFTFATNVDFSSGIDVTGQISVTKAVNDTDFTNDNLPGATSGLYVANSQQANGVWSALTAMAYNDITNNQSASFIVKSVDGTTTTPEVYITQRSVNTQRTAIKIPNDGSVDINYAGSTKLSTSSSGISVTGNIAVSGTVDGVDIAARNTLFGGLTSSSGVLTNGVTATTQSSGDNSTKVATTAYTDTAISNLVDSSPSALNTLNELAAALGDDANFSTTVTNSIATKLPLAGGTLTGKVIIDHNSSTMLELKPQNSSPWVIGINRDDLDQSRVFAHNPSGGVGVGWVFEHNPYFYNGGSYNKILSTADEGAGNGIDADSVDGMHANQFLNIAGDEATGDITFSGGTGAVTLSAGSDIRMSSGSWTGEHAGKIQFHDNRLYFQGGSNGFQFRDSSGGGVIDLTASGSITGKNLAISQDVTFNGGAGAVTIGGNSDIRLSSGNWTGEHAGKIQHHSNLLYIQGGSNGFYFRNPSGTNVLTINGSGNISRDSGSIQFDRDIVVTGGAGGVTVNAGSDIRFTNGDWTGNVNGTAKIQHHSNYLYISGGTAGIIFRENDSDRWVIDGSGDFVPGLNNQYDIGSSSNRVKNIYTNDLNLSNEGSINDVDGTWGSYTIQEGEESLFLINKRNGKKYKFNLTEVS